MRDADRDLDSADRVRQLEEFDSLRMDLSRARRKRAINDRVIANAIADNATPFVTRASPFHYSRLCKALLSVA